MSPATVLECAPLSARPLAPDEADRLAAALKVLADATRLRLLSLIAHQPGGEACACHFADGALGVGQPTVSHHLKVLAEAGLVSRTRRGTQIWYAVDRDAVDAIREALA